MREKSLPITAIVLRSTVPHESVAAGGSGVVDVPVAAVGTFRPPESVPSQSWIASVR